MIGFPSRAAKNCTADFPDMGRRIVLNKRKLTEESSASTLQLENQKWELVMITGNAEYQEFCVRAALKYGLKLAKPMTLTDSEDNMILAAEP